jgi:ribosomal protein S8
MRYLILSITALFFSCNEKTKKQATDFNEKVVDFAIENSNNKYIELPNLYDSLSKEIVTKDENEKLIVVQILKKKGFEVKDWGRGNHPLGTRIIVLKLKKGNCECEVLKTYYSTDSLPKEIYKTTESIRCKKASQ